MLALAVAVGLAVAVSPFASASPDGLEKVAMNEGFDGADSPAKFTEEGSPIPDYAFPGIKNERVATGMAGFVGTLGVFALGFGLALLLARRRRSAADGGAGGGPSAAAA